MSPDLLIVRVQTVSNPRPLFAEAQALDADTHIPVAALPLKEMGTWLTENGYQPLLGSQGFWERPRQPWYRRRRAAA